MTRTCTTATYVNDKDIWGVRTSLRFMPSDSSTSWSSAIFSRSARPRASPSDSCRRRRYINGFGVGLPNFDYQLDGDTDAHTLLSDLTEPLNDLDQSGVYATVGWQASEKVEFKSITSWRKMDNTFLVDGDGQVGNQFLPGIIPDFLPLFHIFQDQEQSQFSQELQFLGNITDKIDYVAGIYYFTEENQQITENAVLSPMGTNRYTDSGLSTTSYAGYASFDFRLGDNLTLTAGGRWTEDTKDFDITAFYPDGTQMIACVAPDGTIVSSQTPCGPGAPPGSVDTPVEKYLKESWNRFTPAHRPVLERTGEHPRLCRHQHRFQIGRLRRQSQRGLDHPPAPTHRSGGHPNL